MARPLHLPRLLTACVVLVLTGCATNPVTGRKEFSLVSTDQELQMGREGYKAVLAEYGVYGDSTTQRFVNEVGQKMARISHLPNLEWHFTVIDDPAVNAFAMPGGYIYITRGILAHLNSEAQLAGVVGHEIAHVTHRHSAGQMSQQQLAGIGLGVASILSPTVGRYSQLAQQGLGLMFLKYSRSHENEADATGVDYAVKAGYDPAEIPSTYEMLKRVGERAGQRLPGFLSTHPDPGDRQVRTTELARTASQGHTGLVIHKKEYLRRLEGMTFDTDPRQGYFEGDAFYHPGLRFTLTFPAGWQKQNTHAAVMAAAAEQRAAMQLSLADAQDLSPSDFVAKLTNAGNITRSSGKSERIGDFPAWVGYVATPGESGSERLLVAAFVRYAPGQMFQFLGMSQQTNDADAQAVFASIRSLRALTEAGRLSPVPARVKVSAVPGATTFAKAVAALGTQALDVEGTGILNNRHADDPLTAGDLIKTVTPSRVK